MEMTEFLDFLLALSVSLFLFAVPIAVLKLIGKIFKIEAINETFRW